MLGQIKFKIWALYMLFAFLASLVIPILTLQLHDYNVVASVQIHISVSIIRNDTSCLCKNL